MRLVEKVQNSLEPIQKFFSQYSAEDYKKAALITGIILSAGIGGAALFSRAFTPTPSLPETHLIPEAASSKTWSWIGEITAVFVALGTFLDFYNHHVAQSPYPFYIEPK